ncbi:hypothetical protein PSTEL_26205 [Paenibacillus stellifer]|uniref:FIST domain-containing protein n=1 Tax=Paenibacillus stellifer TaxID=169760 RepID=A0A089M3K4_9BACL|nr:FIST N-terminal domain-containing protein [Paenibacillus stellifer]AIQ66088.1 hypothetical protein PSTEL_26205 [Paenibacillus stellifer]
MRAVRFINCAEAQTYLDRNADSGKICVLFAPVPHVLELSATAPPGIILCSTAGEYSSEGYEDGVITGFECAAAEAEVVEIGDPPILSLDRLEEAYGRAADNPEAFMLLLCDGLNGGEELLLSTFFSLRPDFKIIGGSAGDGLQFKETYIFADGRRMSNVALLISPKGRTSLIKENIYSRTGTTMLVTKADVLNRTVYTFNNRPASEVYARLLGVREEELAEHFINHPLGKEYESDIFIASPMKVNSDRSITFYCELMANTFVHLLKPEDPLEVVQRTLREAPRSPSFVFAVHCILRSLKFKQEELWDRYDREIIDYCRNTAGFVSYGEQYYRHHSNQTMVMLVVEEDEDHAQHIV